MRKLISLAVVTVFALSFVLGSVLTTAEARPPIPATYKCINHDMYFCILVGANPLTECCEWYEDGCGSGWVWYWYWEGGNQYTCVDYPWGTYCILHDCS
jgi:hypothetical protein